MVHADPTQAVRNAPAVLATLSNAYILGLIHRRLGDLLHAAQKMQVHSPTVVHLHAEFGFPAHGHLGAILHNFEGVVIRVLAQPIVTVYASRAHHVGILKFDVFDVAAPVESHLQHFAPGLIGGGRWWQRTPDGRDAAEQPKRKVIVLGVKTWWAGGAMAAVSGDEWLL